MTRTRQNRRSWGRPVDAHGGPAIDPTENVLAAVDTESRYQTDMRRAEIRRQDELAAMRERYEHRIADILAAQVASSSAIIAGQLDRAVTAFNSRVTALEQHMARGMGRSEVLAWVFSAVVLATAVTGVVVQTIPIFKH